MFSQVISQSHLPHTIPGDDPKKKNAKKDKLSADPERGSRLHLQPTLHLPPEERGKYVIQEEDEDWWGAASQGLSLGSAAFGQSLFAGMVRGHGGHAVSHAMLKKERADARTAVRNAVNEQKK